MKGVQVTGCSGWEERMRTERTERTETKNELRTVQVQLKPKQCLLNKMSWNAHLKQNVNNVQFQLSLFRCCCLNTDRSSWFCYTTVRRSLRRFTIRHTITNNWRLILIMLLRRQRCRAMLLVADGELVLAYSIWHWQYCSVHAHHRMRLR